MMQAEVFTKPGCPYCVAAKQLLVKRNIPYVERDITRRDHWNEIKSRVPSFRTVPQIFLDEAHIGGFDDLVLHFRRSTQKHHDEKSERKGLVKRIAHLFDDKEKSNPQ